MKSWHSRMNRCAAKLFKKPYRNNPHGSRMPCQRALIENNPQNLIELCSQFGVVTRAFLTTSTGGPELLSHRTGNRLRQTISIFDLRAGLWIANIGPSNPRFKEMQVNGHSLTAFRCLEFITDTSTSMRSASLLTRAGLLALHRARRQMPSSALQVRSSFLSTGSISR
jgi:hypothetical protein